MALSSETRRSPRYIGTGSETIFPFAFKLLKPTDLEVRVALSGQVETTLEESAYTVVLNESQDNNPGGTVTLKAPLAKDAALVIISDTPYLQPTTYTNRGGFYPEQLNTNLDRLTILTQQLKEHLDRTITVPPTSPTSPQELFYQLLNAAKEALESAQSAEEALAACEQIRQLIEQYSWDIPHLVDTIRDVENYPYDGFFVVGGYGNPGHNGQNISNRYVKAEGSTELRTLGERFADVVNVKDFGAVGDGVTDDTAAILAALSEAKGKRIAVNPAERYRITAPISYSYSLVCSESINLIVDFEPNGQYEKAVDLNGSDNNIEELNIFVKGSNKFNVVIHASDGRYGRVSIDAENFSELKPSFAAAGAFNVYYDNNVTVGSLKINNFWCATYFGRSNDINIGSLTATNTVRGAQFYLCNRVSVDSMRVESGLDLINWKSDFNNASGANGIVIQACKDFSVGTFISKNTISHGIRISPETDYDTERVSFGTVIISGSGREDVKCCGNTVDSDGGFTGTPAWMQDIVFGNITVIDAGMTSDKALSELNGNGEFSDYDGKGPAGGSNEFAISLVHVRRCSISSATVNKRSNKYASCSVGLFINSCTNIFIPSTYIYDCYYYGMEIKEGYSNTNHVSVSGTICRVGTYADNTTNTGTASSSNTRGYGLFINSDVEDLAAVNLNLFMYSVRRAVKHSIQAFAGPVVIDGYSCNNYVKEESSGVSSSWYQNNLITISQRA